MVKISGKSGKQKVISGKFKNNMGKRIVVRQLNINPSIYNDQLTPDFLNKIDSNKGLFFKH